MNIQSINLYNANNDCRIIKFNATGINIITGASKKGKSSLIEIVEYCLGSSECNVAKGLITQTVSWYSILLNFKDVQVFIARSAPKVGQQTSSKAHLIIEKNVLIPTTSQGFGSDNIESIVKFLTSKMGMEESITEVKENHTRNSIDIDFKHSKYYLFQGQDEIANKRTLFHRQSEQYIPQAIKDTLPYFLGAVDSNRLSELENLRQLKRRKIILDKKIYSIKSMQDKDMVKARVLLSEAISVGLVENTGRDDALNVLNEAVNWRPDIESLDNIDYFDGLKEKYHAKRQEKKEIRMKIAHTKSLSNTMSDYKDEVVEQENRLRSINLYEKISLQNYCPMCDEKYVDPVEATIKNAMLNLKDNLSRVEVNSPRVISYIADLERQDRVLASEIKEIKLSLESIQLSRNAQATAFNDDESRLRVAGRISLYLEDSTHDDIDIKPLESELSSLVAEINDLEVSLDPAAVKERLDSQLSCISEDMTQWARELKLEHSQFPIRLDVSKLTVVAETPAGKIPLDKMGSGENWIGYHLITYLALAKWFINQDRPVARFMFFDQPSQVYFPSDSSVTGKMNEIDKDEDREAVKRMFKFIFKTVDNFIPELQVIITDHADIDEEWFSKYVVDDKWRGDKALIPQSWYM